VGFIVLGSLKVSLRRREASKTGWAVNLLEGGSLNHEWINGTEYGKAGAHAEFAEAAEYDPKSRSWDITEMGQPANFVG
jgi:hypothetical protein